MKNNFFLLLILVAVSMLISCEAGDTGNFKVRLRLPIDEGICKSYGYDDEEDYTYCINKDDQILLSIYSAANPYDEFVYADRKLIPVSSDSGKVKFIRSLKKGTYYRFFVEVTNSNEKLKLTGGLDSILYDDEENYEVDIFLGAVGDFVRVVKDRTDPDSSLKSYMDVVSKGSAAVALRGGLLYMSGGYDVDNDDIIGTSMIFNLKNMTSKKVKNLPEYIYDHAAAFLDDNSTTGKVVLAFGSQGDTYYHKIIGYDPEKDKYFEIGAGESLTRAKALTIDGDVYIIGGCNKNNASNKIYQVKKDYSLVSLPSLQTGRCNHSVADVSIVNEDGTIQPRILVFGGTSDEEGKNPIVKDKFAEIVTLDKSSKIALQDRNGLDSSEILDKGLVSAGSVSLIMDDLEESEIAVAVVGGYLQDGDEDNKALITSPNLYIFSEIGENKWVYDVNGAPNKCARPSIGAIGSPEKSISKYAAVNCGSGDIGRTNKSASDQIIFVVQVKRSPDSDLGINIFSASVKDTLMIDNKDIDNDQIVDGPLAVNELGQAFIFGTRYVYVVSGYALP